MMIEKIKHCIISFIAGALAAAVLFAKSRKADGSGTGNQIGECLGEAEKSVTAAGRNNRDIAKSNDEAREIAAEIRRRAEKKAD